MHGQLHVKESWLWVDLMRSPDVRMHVSLTGVLVAVQHGQDVRHVAFSPSPSLSFLCILSVLVPANLSLCPSVSLSLWCVCACMFVGVIKGLVCVFALP